MSEKIVVFDTTLRDGDQSAGVSFSARDKVDIAKRLAAIHTDMIEVGFPAASPGEFEAVRAVCRALPHARICALARCNPIDVDAAAEALAEARHRRIHLFVNSSEVQLTHQLRKDHTEVLALADAMVRRARNATDDVEFSPMDATRAAPEFLAELTRVALRAGATTINVPDTVGVGALPGQVEARIRDLHRRVPELASAVVSFHGQNDLGLATANALAAIAGGARQVELAVNGIGERAGNTSFEEVVMAIHLHGGAMGVHTDVDTTGIYELSRLVEERSGLAVAANKAIVGRNAFRHASGIHQDGVLKHRSTYEAFDPALIGHPRGTEIVLSKLSGRAGFQARVRALGLELQGGALERAFGRFQRLADEKREVGEADLIGLCREDDLTR